MNKERLFRGRLVGITLGILLALAIVPATGWLVRLQIALSLRLPAADATMASVGMPSWHGAEDREAAERRFAAEHADNVDVQIAGSVDFAASAADIGHTSDAALRALRTRFSNSPALYANILRFATSQHVHVHRKEQDELYPISVSANPGVPRPADVSSPDALAQFDADAATGERLDPDNAYFPLMRAAGLFETHRDADAVAAILRAGQKPHWDEYWSNEIAGRMGFIRSALGDRSSMAICEVWAATLFPMFAQMRAVARMALVEAIRAEKAGHPADGVAIRHALMACAGKMRVQSRTLIGNLVGIAVSYIMVSRPGGAPEPKSTSDISKEERTRRAYNRYSAWLTRVHLSNEAPWAKSEMEADLKVSDIIRRGIAGPDFLLDVLQTVGWWICGLLLLSNAAWMLALGAVATRVSKSRHSAHGEPLPSATARVIGPALVAGTIATITIVRGVSNPVLVLTLALVLGAAVAVPFGETKRNLPREAALFGALMLVPYAIYLMTLWQGAGVHSMVGIYTALFGGAGDASGPETDLPNAVRVISTIARMDFVPLVPILVFCILAIISRVHRIPLSIGIIAGFRRIGLPIACLLLLCYSAVAVATAHREAVTNQALELSIQHEGRYRAGLVGLKWPDQN